jgi:hypothetical protein
VYPPTATDESLANIASTVHVNKQEDEMADGTGSSSSGGGRTVHTFTLEELLGGTNLKARDWYLIDPELWYREVKAPDDDMDVTVVATYIARAIADYTEGCSGDDELFAEFC